LSIIYLPDYRDPYQKGKTNNAQCNDNSASDEDIDITANKL